jgi:ABC-2 type transport system ATP-binding protein
VAYVSQAQQLPGWMSLEELCRYVAHFYEHWDAALAKDLAARWELPWQRALARLSGGEQRLAAVLAALAAQPEVMLLDEPAAGLDPVARRSLLTSLLEALNRGDGCTVLLSTHLVSDLERVAEHVGIMDRGRVTTSLRLDELLQTTKRVQVVFDRPGPPPDFVVPGAVRSHTAGPVVTAIAHLANEAQLDPVRQMPGARVNVFPLNLEEVFIELFGKRERESFTEEEVSAGSPACLAAQFDRQ